MEMTSQGADREIKDSLLTKIYKASKENAAISQRKTEAQPRLRSHHYYGFDTKYVSLQSLLFFFFLKIQDTQLEQFLVLFIQFPFLHM